MSVAADLVSRACLREWISEGCPHPLILHADNGNAMRAATLESQLERAGSAQILLQGQGEQRQPLF
jgi:putative transposase